MRFRTLNDAMLDLAEDVPDVRGLEVRTSDGNTIGTIDEVLLDETNHPLYLDVDRGVLRKHILVPIEYTQLAGDADALSLQSVGADRLDAWPEYTGDLASVTPDYEARVHGVFGRSVPTNRTVTFGRGIERDVRHARGAEADREARVIRAEEELAVGKRRVPAGEVGLRKIVETKHVQQSVPLSREEIDVERRPLSAGASADVDITEDEIRIPITEEQLVVEKRAVPKEEIVVKKRVVTEDRTVEADLRTERVDVDDKTGRWKRARDDEART